MEGRNRALRRQPAEKPHLPAMAVCVRHGALPKRSLAMIPSPRVLLAQNKLSGITANMGL